MRSIKDFFLLLLFLFPGIKYSTAQQKVIDSLENLVKIQKEDTNKLFTLFSLSRALYTQGYLEEGLKYTNEEMELAKKLDNKKGLSSSYNNFANIYRYQGKLPLALKNHLSALKIREEIGYKKGIAASYGGIGIIYADMSNFDEARKNYFKAQKVFEEIGNEEGVADVFVSVGITYEQEAEKDPSAASRKIKFRAAVKNYTASLKVYETLGDSQRIAMSYNDLGTAYDAESEFCEKDSVMFKHRSALEYQLKALAVQQAIGNIEDLALTYNNIAQVYLEENNYPLSLEYANKGLDAAKKVESLDDIKNAERGISQLYEKIHNTDLALVHYKAYIQARDSLFNDENTKKTVRTQMEYEFDKKERTTKAEQDVKDAFAEAEKQKQKLITFSIGAGLLLVIAFSILLFNRFRLISRQKKIIEEQKETVEIQKKIVEHQKEMVEEKQKEILDSIYYARRIQRSILPTEKYIVSSLARLMK